MKRGNIEPALQRVSDDGKHTQRLSSLMEKSPDGTMEGDSSADQETILIWTYRLTHKMGRGKGECLCEKAFGLAKGGHPYDFRC